mmetsp:Transcript_57803/g.108310  ORF Transcript_57803/g.108310 Transcript_57803/m.108310 type:complete len:213 (+) Transcript_57803:60-698(+)
MDIEGPDGWHATSAAHRHYLRRLQQPCLDTLGGNFTRMFREPTLAERYPRFGNKSPREKSASPRLPGALHQLFRQPEVQASVARTWWDGLPSHERSLRRVLWEKVPGSKDPPSLQSSPREPEPPEILQQRREDQAKRLEYFLQKVRPGKEPQSPLIAAAQRRLQRLQETLPSSGPTIPEEDQAIEQEAGDDDHGGDECGAVFAQTEVEESEH